MDTFKEEFRELMTKTHEAIMAEAESADKAFAVLEEAVEDVEEELYDELVGEV